MEKEDEDVAILPNHQKTKPSGAKWSKPAVVILVLLSIIEFALYFTSDISIPLEAAFKQVSS